MADNNEDLECSWPAPKRVLGPALPTDDVKVEVGFRTLVTLLLNPVEGLTVNGLYGRKRITPQTAALIKSYAGWDAFVTIEKIDTDLGTTLYLWDRHEHHTTYQQHQLRRKQHEISRTERLFRSERLKRTLDAVLDKHPKLARDRSLAFELVDLWASEPETYRKQLEKFGFFDGVEEHSEQLRMLKQDLADYQERMKEKYYG